MIEKLIIAVLVSIVIAGVYLGFALVVAAYLRENSKNYPEVK